MIDSFLASKKLWGRLDDFWDLVDNKGIITPVWQGLIEKINDLKNKQDAIIYSIEEIPETVSRLWIKYDTTFGKGVVSVPTLVDNINRKVTEYVEDTNYTIATAGTIIWITAEPTAELWAPVVIYENTYILSMFNSGFLDLDLSYFSYQEKKDIVRLMWNAIKYGSTTFYLEAVINALAGMPFMAYQGILGITATNFKSEYLVPANILYDSGALIYAEKDTITEITIESNKFSGSDYDAGLYDTLKISGEYYHIIEDDDDTMLLYPLIDDGSYSDVTVYVASEIGDEITRFGVIYDPETGNNYSITNNVIAQMPDGEHENMVLSHYYVRMRIDGDDKIEMEKAIIEDVPNNDYEAGDIAPSFAPLQRAFRLYTWKDIQEEEYEDLSGGDLADPLNIVYNNELKITYRIAEDVDDSSEIELISDSFDDNIVADSYIEIYKKVPIDHTIESIEEDDDGYWDVVVEDKSYLLKLGDTIQISQEYEEDDGGLTVHRGGHYQIIHGEYKNGKYYLKFYDDLGTLSTHLAVDGGILSIVRYVKYVRKVASISDSDNYIITIKGKITLSKDDLIMIKKASLGEYGLDNRYDVSSVVSDVITLDEDPGNALYQSIIISDDDNPSTIYTVVQQTGAALTVDRTVEYSYTSGICILLKTIEQHNGFSIIMDDEVENKGDVLAAIETAQPNYVSNINKVLDILLPSGWKYKWQIGEDYGQISTS